MRFFNIQKFISFVGMQVPIYSALKLLMFMFLKILIEKKMFSKLFHFNPRNIQLCNAIQKKNLNRFEKKNNEIYAVSVQD